MGEKSLRDRILEAEDSPFEEVDVPEWKEKIRIRTMSGEERYEFESSLTDTKNIMVRMLAVTLCDLEGNRLFTLEDMEKLNKKNSKVLIRLFSKAKKLNAIDKSDIEELTKN